ncbi:uncharacterized protein [Clytia hemisphaerica]|uniref:uncharacterized protein n=1 Tax=Clytia hemisphaerica TaxID=252671 RepID=UPI0034D39838
MEDMIRDNMFLPYKGQTVLRGKVKLFSYDRFYIVSIRCLWDVVEKDLGVAAYNIDTKRLELENIVDSFENVVAYFSCTCAMESNNLREELKKKRDVGWHFGLLCPRQNMVPQNLKRKYPKRSCLLVLMSHLADQFKQEVVVDEIIKRNSKIIASTVDLVSEDVCDKMKKLSLDEATIAANSQYSDREEPVFTILLFQDGVGLCNPIGNRNTKHNMVNFYWTLCNIPPKYRSKLSAINLLISVNKIKLNKYGFEAVMKPFLDDMDKLFRGYFFTINGKEQLCFGNVILCIGDNEGQHQIGGFKVGIGFALRKCRRCFATAEDIQGNLKPTLFVNRSKQEHCRVCQIIETLPNGTAKDQIQVNYGIIGRSALSFLNDFDVTKQLPNDIMHDLLEGVVPYEIKLCLEALIKDKFFTLEEFNYLLQTFEFSYSDKKSKPEALKSSIFTTDDRKIKYSAENARILLKIIPYLLDVFLPVDNVYFQFLSSLSRIVALAFSPLFTFGTIGYLSQIIEEHCSVFKSIFPQENLIPKHHYLFETPSLIPRFGPPVRYSCMRFEAMHKTFKSFLPFCNFSHLETSLANRYLKHTATSSFLCSSREDGPGKSIPPAEMDLIRKKHPFDDFPVHSSYLNWITLNGTKYIARHCFLAVDADSNTELPMFGKLVKIICAKVPIFVLSMLETFRFDNDFVGYQVSPEFSQEQMKPFTGLLDYNIYQVVKNQADDRFVPLKYDLCDIISEHICGNNPLMK